MIDLDALPDDARQLLESDLSSLEFSDSVFDLPQASPVQVQEDMTLFNDPDTEHPSDLWQVSVDPTVLSASSTELDLDEFDFSTSDPLVSEANLSLENFVPSQSISVSTSETSMPQDHPSNPVTHESSLPENTGLSENTGEFNAFSFDGLDDELFEPSPEPNFPTSITDERSLESENLLKKKIAP